jgi:O-antigen/teichoic acid export membrane protein
MNRFSKNILSLFSADMARRVLGFISVAYLARILGKEGFGTINIGFAVLSYVMVLGSAGFPTLGAKKIAQGRSAELVGQVIGSRLVTTVIVLIITVVAVLSTVENTSIAWIIILFSCAVVPQIFFVDWFFQGKETMEFVSIARVAQALIYLIVVLVFVKTIDDVMWVAGGSIAGELMASVMLYKKFNAKYKEVRLRIRPSITLFKQALPLSIGIILSTLIVNYPQIALGIFNDTSSVGVYSAASKLVYFLLMGDRVLVLILLPVSARKFSNSAEEFSSMLSEALRWILLLALPVAVGGMLISDDIIKILFGMDYLISGAVLKVLIWYFFLTMLHTIYIAGLIGVGGERSYWKIMLITAAAYLICVSSGAYWYGAIGTAFGVVIAEGFSVVLINSVLRRYVDVSMPDKIIRVIISALIMGSVVAYVIQYGLLWALLAGAASYCTFIIVFKAVVWVDVKKLLARF